MLHGLITGADAAAGALVMAVLESVVLISGAALCLRLLPGLSAAARSMVWTGALVLVVLLPVLPFVFAGQGGHEDSGSVHVDAAWGLGLVCFWGVLSVWRAGALAMSALRLRGIARRAVPVDASAVCAEILQGNGRSAELCVSLDVDRPSAAGFFWPRVLMPAELFAQLGDEELETIVRHEMEHLRRRDDWTNLLQKVSLVVFPLNPVLLWLDRRMSLERELACDDSVLRQTRARKAYAACLTNLAEGSMMRRGVSLALGAWGRQTELTRRVHRILAWREAGMGRRSAAAVTGVLLLSVTAGTAMLARSPQLVHFSAAEPRTAASLEVAPLLRIKSVSASREEVSARPQLVRAAMPEVPSAGMVRTGLRLPAGRRRGRRMLPVRSALQMRRIERPVQPVVMLTGWHDMGLPAKMVPAVANEDQLPRFAAVATRDGWLIFQL